MAIAVAGAFLLANAHSITTGAIAGAIGPVIMGKALGGLTLGAAAVMLLLPRYK